MNKNVYTVITAIVMGILLTCCGEDRVRTRKPGLNWMFNYDEAGRITRFVDPGGKVTEISYKLDRKNQNQVRRMTKKVSRGAKVTFVFDDFGRRIAMDDAPGRVQYEYDSFDRLKAVHRNQSPSISYTYDTLDRLSSISVGDEWTIHYAYDFLGRLANMSTPAGDISYDYGIGQGMIVRTLPNGIRTTWEYLPDGNLESISHADNDNYLIAQFTYVYRPDGLISQIKERSPQGERILAYEYDIVQRLIGFTDSEGEKITYSYDKFGNRTEIRYGNGQTIASTYDWAGRIMTYNSEDSAHDDSGNLTSYLTKDGRRVFEYDGANLLKRVDKGEARYEYDGDGYLIARSVERDRTTFIPNPLTDIWQPLLATERDGSQTFYIWEGSFPLVAIENGEAKFFLHDHLGSVRSVADQHGKIGQQLNYSPFGVPQQQFTEGELQPGFAGLFFDPKAQLYLTHARGYDPGMGRFLQRDPLDHQVSFIPKIHSTYLYCHDDPVNFTDRSGSDDQAATIQPFLDYINGVTGPHFSHGLGLGVGSGTLSPEYIATNFGKGRFPVIVVWGSEQGAAMDLFRATFWDTAGGARERIRRLPIRIDNYVAHSAGNFMRPSGTKTIIRLDPAGYGLSQNEIYEPGIVSDLTGVDLKTPFSKGILGISFTAKLDNFRLNNLGKAAKEAVGDMFRFGKAGTQVFTWTTKMPFTEEGPFSSHALEPKLDKLEAEGYIPSRGTYQNVQIIYMGDDGSIKRTETLNYQKISKSDSDIDVNLDPRKKPRSDNIPFPFGGGPPGPPGGGSGGSSALSPSNVGGIYLREAGKTLEGLGQLSGIALDKQNGNLALLSEEKGAIDLPPLRLDDVVTIFRSVYKHGEAPSVSIDPNPKDPKGDFMIIAHGPGTDDTYVGWVLFEADRVMKAYSLGQDNIMKKPVQSQIEGYEEVLGVGFLGEIGKQIWERFWIVPAQVNREQTADKQLTLFDVPLKVRTQKMVMRNGKLEPAPDDKPSEGAKAFAGWFTDNYDKISAESMSQPPKESGINVSVPVFRELRRVALITAIAEHLQDQGVPLPFWMQDYQVIPCTTPPNTPAITVERSKGTTVRTTYGGVRLAAPDSDIQTVAAAPEIEELAPIISRTIAQAPMFSPISIKKERIQYQAVALPGTHTKALGPCRLSEVDLVVPVQGGTNIALVRRFNSFFQPVDVFGKPWTLDLPYLEQQKVPTKRIENRTEYKIVYQLTSPLNSYSERFMEVKFVPEVNSELFVPNTESNILGLANTQNKKIGFPTQVVLFRDSRRWHFDNTGNLVAIEENPLTTIYRRDKTTGRIQRIEGWYGKNLHADIRLQFDNQGRLEFATGSNQDTVKYIYDTNDGVLTHVKTSVGNIEYRYKEGFVTEIWQDGQLVRQFVYTDQGQLMREKYPDGSEVAYNVTSDEKGFTIIASKPDTKAEETVHYDSAFRPLQHIFEDNTQIRWEYSEDNAVKAEIALPTGEQYIIKRSSDGKQETLQLPKGITYQVDYDDNGRLIALQQNQRQMLHQKWHNDGKLASAMYETFAVHPEYRDDGIVTSMLITPPEEGTQFNRWLGMTYDELGRVRKITDYSGSDISIGYDKSGEVAAISSNQGGVHIQRNAQDLIDTVQTSWGLQQNNTYDQNGRLKRVELAQGNSKSVLEFEEELPKKIRQFDGGELTISYYDEGIHKGQTKEIRTPVNFVSYEYDDDNQITAVNCGGTYRLEYTRDDQERLVHLRQIPIKN